MVTGTLRARVVLLPQGGGCGQCHPLAVPWIQRLYEGLMPPPQQQQRRLVLIKRSHSRRLAQHNRLAKTLASMLNGTPLRLTVFGDAPPPSYEQTQRLFAEASVVVAPHGAGLANVVYCQPGTYVIEILPAVKQNLCFKGLCACLGHVYIGLIADDKSKSGAMYVDVAYLTRIIQNVLAYI